MKKILKTISSAVCCDYYYADEKTGCTYCSLSKKYIICPPRYDKFPRECPLEDYEE